MENITKTRLFFFIPLVRVQAIPIPNYSTKINLHLNSNHKQVDIFFRWTKKKLYFRLRKMCVSFLNGNRKLNFQFHSREICWKNPPLIKKVKSNQNSHEVNDTLKSFIENLYLQRRSLNQTQLQKKDPESWYLFLYNN